MACGICLDGYTEDARPAALPCGHVFHAPCAVDWLQRTAAPGGVRGCPLCKAPATPEHVLCLWPSDTHDFYAYVAAHNVQEEPQPVLDAACRLTESMQSYAMAAHGLRSAPMGRVRDRISEAVRQGAVRDADAALALQNGIDALHDMVQHVEGVAYTLSKAYTASQRQAHEARVQKAAVEEERRGMAAESKRIQRDRRALRHKQQLAQQETEALERRAAEMRACEQATASEHAQALARMHENTASAKSASVEAIRRAVLREEAAEQRESAADTRIHAAEEQASDAAQALQAIRARNQRMADQMRDLQTAVQRAQKKYRALRAKQDEKDTQHEATQATFRHRIARLEARSSEAESDRGSSPPLQRSRYNPAQIVPLSQPTKEPVDVWDENEFPMPGGDLLARPSVRRPLLAVPNRTWAGNVLGPRRRPR